MRPRMLPAVGLALALATIHAPSARAGTYTVHATTAADASGWILNADPGFWGCSRDAYPGPCGDGDVNRPTPLRALSQGDAAAGGALLWAWWAPPTTSIVDGTVAVDYSTSADKTTVFMKSRLRSETYASSPMLHSVQGSDSVDWAIPSGNQIVTVGIRTAAAHTYSDKWLNSFKVPSLTATVRDDTAPTATISGALTDGAWHNEAHPLAVRVAAADSGAGVSRLELAEAGAVLDSATPPATSASQPGALDVARELAVAPSALGDGVHALTVTARDAAGEAVTLPLTLRVDTHAPTASAAVPAGSTTLRRPHVSFAVDPGPSGLASFEALLDGGPMAVSGTTASLAPAADLAFGTHTVTWHATDGAGNARDGFWTFDVLDPAPPELTQPAPADGWSGELRRPTIGFLLTDAGTGVDASTLRVALDGLDITAGGTFADGRFELVPGAPLDFGEHRVRVAASDRSGNAMAPAEWRFSVVDRTPPVLSDVRPDPGSAGADRTPPISLAATDGDGTGVDAASLVLTLDGGDVSARATASGGRFAYTPPEPLAFGMHTVSARVADLAGNVAPAREWSFTVRDETPPVIAGRTPADGATVAGATTIGFDMSDAGIGLDVSTLHVLVDGADAVDWGTLRAGHWSYSPGNLGPGPHSVAVTVADRAGNVAGPVVWQFAVASPATLGLAFRSGPTALDYGARGTLTFTATSDGEPLAGAAVLVSTRPAGQPAFGPAHTLWAGSGGVVSWPIHPPHNTWYRAVLADDPAAAVSRRVVVRQRVTLAAGQTTVRRGSLVRLSGRVTPAHPAAHVTLQLLTSRGWTTVARPVLSASSAYAKVVIPPVRGRYAFRALVSPTPLNGAATSRVVTVLAR